MFQRALAKRPEDRGGTTLELAAALRAASGIGTTHSDLPRLDRDVRDAWLADAPQPLAESIAELGGAHSAYQARDIAKALLLPAAPTRSTGSSFCTRPPITRSPSRSCGCSSCAGSPR